MFAISDGILINDGCKEINILDALFLVYKHNGHVLKVIKKQKNLYQMERGVLFYVNKLFIQRPFNTASNEKNAFFSILNLSPNTK